MIVTGFTKALRVSESLKVLFTERQHDWVVRGKDLNSDDNEYMEIHIFELRKK